MWVRGPRGENLDPLLGGKEPNLAVLNPGQQQLLARNAPHFGATPVTYTVGVSYLSTNGDWINLPSGNNGAVTQRSISPDGG